MTGETVQSVPVARSPRLLLTLDDYGTVKEITAP